MKKGVGSGAGSGAGVRGTKPGIRICTKMSWIPNTASLLGRASGENRTPELQTAVTISYTAPCGLKDRRRYRIGLERESKNRKRRIVGFRRERSSEMFNTAHVDICQFYRVLSAAL